MANITTTKTRIKYIDTLKFLAIFAIIALHIFRLWPNAEILNFSIVKFAQITQFGVALFLLVSGSLLLKKNKKIEIEPFIKKKFVRIILPLIFYLILAFIFNVYHSILSPYWYAWMIICTYLTIPVINIFIQNAKMKEIEYFLILFTLAVLIYQLALFFGIKHCLDLNFFIGPVSFLILGYYLSKKELTELKRVKLSNNQIIIISIIIFILSSVLRMKFDGTFNFDAGKLYSCIHFSFLQIVQVSSVFVMFRYLYEAKEGIFSKIRRVLETKTINKFILSVSRSSYGMYLFHMLIYRGFLEDYMKGFHLTGTQVCLSIIGLSIGLFIISWLGVLILGQIPYIKKLSGYY